MPSDGPCPSCGSARVARILYGLRRLSDEQLSRDLDEGRAVLGGCMFTEDSPAFVCHECGHRWGENEQAPRSERRP